MRKLAPLWGIGGFIAILVIALDRLIPVTLSAFDWNFTWWHWVLLVGNTLAMAYYEGYKGFQRGYSPRVAARARYLHDQGAATDCLLAPLFCMSFYAAPKRRKIATWVLTLFITLMIILFQYLPQPTRGILDAGVVVGLSWGLIATLYYAFAAFSGSLNVDHEVIVTSQQ
ncbi:MAG: hypothetical protein KTR32_34235 [Granulosicoccus sp.]|nr:hypothetical protein [Granulosicoccus sp.]